MQADVGSIFNLPHESVYTEIPITDMCSLRIDSIETMVGEDAVGGRSWIMAITEDDRDSFAFSDAGYLEDQLRNSFQSVNKNLVDRRKNFISSTTRACFSKVHYFAVKHLDQRAHYINSKEYPKNSHLTDPDPDFLPDLDLLKKRRYPLQAKYIASSTFHRLDLTHLFSLKPYPLYMPVDTEKMICPFTKRTLGENIRLHLEGLTPPRPWVMTLTHEGAALELADAIEKEKNSGSVSSARKISYFIMYNRQQGFVALEAECRDPIKISHYVTATSRVESSIAKTAQLEIAQSFISQKKYKEAIYWLEITAQAYPKDSKAPTLLLELLLDGLYNPPRGGETSAKIKEWIRVALPSDPHTAHHVFALRGAFHLRGMHGFLKDKDLAHEDLSKIIDCYNSGGRFSKTAQAFVLAHWGSCLFLFCQKYAEGRGFLLKAFGLSESAPDIKLLIGDVLTKYPDKENFEKGKKLLGEIAAHEDPVLKVEAQSILSDVYFHKAMYKEAFELATQAIARNSHNERAYIIMGKLYLGGYDVVEMNATKALELYDKAEKIHEKSYQVHAAKGTLLRFGAKGVSVDSQKAFSHLQKTVDLLPTSAEWQIHVAEMLFLGEGVEKNFQKAREQAKVALQHDPKSGQALAILGAVEQSLPAEIRDSAHIAHLEKAVHFAPRSFIAQAHWGISLFDSDNYPRAYQALNTAYELNTEYMLTQFYLGRVCLKRIDVPTDVERGVGLLTQFIASSEKNSHVRSAKIALIIHYIRIKHPDAISISIDLLNDEPNNPMLLKSLGDLYCQGIVGKKDVKTALGYYKKMLEVEPARAEMNQLVGLTLLHGLDGVEKDAASAIKYLEKAYELKQEVVVTRELAAVFRTGTDGVPSDLRRALTLYKVIAQTKFVTSEERIHIALLTYAGADGLENAQARGIKLLKSSVKDAPVSDMRKRAVTLIVKQIYKEKILHATSSFLEKSGTAAYVKKRFVLREINEAVGEDSQISYVHAVEGEVYRRGFANAINEKRALEEYEKALILNPQEVIALVGSAVVLQNGPNSKKMKKLASERLELAIRLEPNNSIALSHLGALLMKGGEGVKKDEIRGEALIRKAYALDPHNSHTKLEYAGLLQKEKSKERAYALIVEIAMKDEMSLEVIRARELKLAHLVNRKEYDKAFNKAKEYVQAFPKSSQLQAVLGELYRVRGDAQKAQKHLTKAKELNTPFAWVYSALGRLAMPSFKEEGGRYFMPKLRLAKSHFNKALKCDPDDDLALRNLGFISYEYEKNKKAACGYFNRVVKRHKDDEVANYYLRRISHNSF